MRPSRLSGAEFSLGFDVCDSAGLVVKQTPHERKQASKHTARSQHAILDNTHKDELSRGERGRFHCPDAATVLRYLLDYLLLYFVLHECSGCLSAISISVLMMQKKNIDRGRDTEIQRERRRNASHRRQESPLG